MSDINEVAKKYLANRIIFTDSKISEVNCYDIIHKRLRQAISHLDYMSSCEEGSIRDASPIDANYGLMELLDEALFFLELMWEIPREENKPNAA